MHSKNWVIQTHKEPHPDELFAIFLLRTKGEKKYQNIPKAEVIFGAAGEAWNFPLENTNIVTVGTGRQLFDEHISAPGKDRIDECAATLVVKSLEIEDRPELQRLLGFIKAHDLRGQHRRMDLADCINALNQIYSDEEVLAIANRIFEALVSHEEMIMEQEHRDKTADFIEEWLKGKDERVTGPITRFVHGLRNGNKSDFDLTEILIKLEKTYNEAKAHEIVSKLLQAQYKAQELYFSAEDLLNDSAVTEIIRVIRGRELFCIVCAETDNPKLSKAARKVLRANIIIQKNSNGRVVILPNLKTPMKREIKNLVAALRLEELKVRGLSLKLSFDRLTYGGMLDEVPYWYFQVEEHHPAGGKILNGSKSATAVEPTAIPLSRIVEIVVTILKLGYYFKWDVWLKRNIDSRLRA